MVSSTTRRVNRVAGACRPEERDAGLGAGVGLSAVGVSPPRQALALPSLI